MSPYTTPLKPIDDVSPFFTKNKDGAMIFVGKTLEVRIPSSFEKHGVLQISEEVTTPGIFDLIIDNAYHVGLNLLATITVIPSNIRRMVYDSIEYVVLELETNDVFMTSTRVIQNPDLVYVLWSEFVTAGKLPYNWTYENTLRMFEHVRELTGQGIGVSRSVFEGIIAYLSRDRDKPFEQYRHTDMKKPFRMVALNDVSLAVNSTLSKLNGAYMRNEGITSALRYQVEEIKPFDNILRGINEQNIVEAR